MRLWRRGRIKAAGRRRVYTIKIGRATEEMSSARTSLKKTVQIPEAGSRCSSATCGGLEKIVS